MPKNKKILFITHYVGLFGANRSLLGLIDGLQSYDFDIIVVSPANGPITVELEKRKIRYYLSPVRYWIAERKRGRVLRLVMNIISSLLIVLIVLRERVQIIYTNSSATPAGAFSAFLARKPHVWHIREFGDLDYGLYHDWGREVFEFWMKKASAIICISNSIKEKVVKDLNSKTYVISNGIISRKDLYEIKTRQEEFYEKENYTFIMIGQINVNKNQEDAIMAISIIKNKYPQVKLLIVGDCNNEYARRLKSICIELNLKDTVTFLGYMEDPLTVLSVSDSLLMCSRNEGMGRVTLEAMMYGKPVIGFNSTGTKEIIGANEVGLLYSNSYQELAILMEKFIKNQLWAYGLGLNGMKKVETSFLIEQYAQKIVDVLSSIRGL